MGWCGDFGCTIKPGCDHGMVAAQRSCRCDACGAVCGGKFSGCREVWAAGPRSRATSRPQPQRRSTQNGGPEAPTAPPPSADALGSVRNDLDELQTAVDAVRREVRSLLTMLDQQQQVLARLVADRPAVATSAPTLPDGDHRSR